MGKLGKVSSMNTVNSFFLHVFGLSRNPQELENVIKLLVSDYAVRKKFPGTLFYLDRFCHTDKSF
jgi:hypothetical protein